MTSDYDGADVVHQPKVTFVLPKVRDFALFCLSENLPGNLLVLPPAQQITTLMSAERCADCLPVLARVDGLDPVYPHSFWFRRLPQIDPVAGSQVGLQERN